MLRPVDPGGAAAREWRARLEVSDLDLRERDYAAFLGAAREDASLVLALEAWAEDVEAPGLAWTARLALRELDASRSRVRLRAHVIALGPPVEGAPQAQSGEPSLDAAARAGAAPFGAPRGVRLHGQRVFALRGLPLGSSEAETFALEVRPEGVSLTVSRSGAGGTTQEAFAGESIAALLAEFPSLEAEVPGLEELSHETLDLGLYIQRRGGGSSRSGALRTPARLEALLGAALRPVPTDILGVKCTPVGPGETASAQLGPGVGLRVERREPGTIAAELGLQRGDILIEVNQEPLCGLEQLSAALRAAHGGALELKILDRDGLERRLTWRP